MRLLRNSTWLLLGFSLGTILSVVFAHRLATMPAIDIVSLASVTVFTMLVGSLQQPWRAAVIPR